jgi:hypothetical protein
VEGLLFHTPFRPIAGHLGSGHHLVDVPGPLADVPAAANFQEPAGKPPVRPPPSGQSGQIFLQAEIASFRHKLFPTPFRPLAGHLCSGHHLVDVPGPLADVPAAADSQEPAGKSPVRPPQSSQSGQTLPWPELPKLSAQASSKESKAFFHNSINLPSSPSWYLFNITSLLQVEDLGEDLRVITIEERQHKTQKNL